MYEGENWCGVRVTRSMANVAKTMRSGGSVWRPHGRKMWYVVNSNGSVSRIRNDIVEKLIQATNGDLAIEYDSSASNDEYLYSVGCRLKKQDDATRSGRQITMTKQKSTRMYVTRVVLKISSVPFDMMRYDRLVPATEEDAHKLDRVATYDGRKSGDHQVTFLRYSLNPGEPTVARYRGFGAEVVSWEPVT